LNDLGVLLAGIGTMGSMLISAAALWITVRRGSDRENRRSATAALEHQDGTVTPINRERDGA
jgi:hypothetical protein